MRYAERKAIAEAAPFKVGDEVEAKWSAYWHRAVVLSFEYVDGEYWYTVSFPFRIKEWDLLGNEKQFRGNPLGPRQDRKVGGHVYRNDAYQVFTMVRPLS
jgi:hypothetical protein